MNRREINAGFLGVFGTAVSPGAARSAMASRPVVRHASIGSTLQALASEDGGRRVTPVGDAVTVPEQVQFGWSNPVRDVLYVGCSDNATTKKDRHFLSAFKVARSGALSPHGQPVQLASRPIHLTTDHKGEHLLVAHNPPWGVSVHRLAKDGLIGEAVVQRAELGIGVYPHQIRVLPSDRGVLLSTRGIDASDKRPEYPGALQVFSFRDGQLAKVQSVAPGAGLGFRPRHADFHPNARWTYVVLESQNTLHTYGLSGDRLTDAPLFISSTLDTALPPKRGQMAATVRVHPNGKRLYVANRGVGLEDFEGKRVGNGGENTIAVFSIDPTNGEPRPMQRIDIRGVNPRAMDISQDGTWLAAGDYQPALVRQGEGLQTLTAGVSLFRIMTDGRLEFAAKQDIDVGPDSVFWVGCWR
jgi:6-phosphogluconolactonase